MFIRSFLFVVAISGLSFFHSTHAQECPPLLEALAPNRTNIYSDELPLNVGTAAPREAELSPAMATLLDPSDPKHLAQGFDSLPRLNFDPDQNPRRLKLLSRQHNGSTAQVSLAELKIDGQMKPVVLKLFTGQDMFDGSAANIPQHLRAEATAAKIGDELGIGPKVYGTTMIDGRVGIVMEPIAGDFLTPQTPITPTIVSDLKNIIQKLAKHRLGVTDFQPMLTTSGRVVLIDFASMGGHRRSGVRFEFALNDMIREASRLTRLPESEFRP
jgi:hypothetical protein